MKVFRDHLISTIVKLTIKWFIRILCMIISDILIKHNEYSGRKGHIDRGNQHIVQFTDVVDAGETIIHVVEHVRYGVNVHSVHYQ